MSEISFAKRFCGTGIALLIAVLTLCFIPAGQQAFAQDEDETEESDGSLGGEAELDPSIWILNVKVKQIRSITMLDGPNKGKVFWYVIYNIHNKTGEARNTFLSASATSDGKKVYADVYQPRVERAIEKKYGQPLWGKTDLIKLQKARDVKDVNYSFTPIPAGKRMDCVAILSKLDPGANKLKVTLRGLSNDLKLIESDDGNKVVEERVFSIDASRPKDRYKIGLDRLIVKKQSWTKIRTPLAKPKSKAEDA